MPNQCPMTVDSDNSDPGYCICPPPEWCDQQRSQFFVALATASASVSTSTKISTLALADFASDSSKFKLFGH